MSRSNKLIFFGNERLATGISTKAPVLNSLIQAGYEIAGLVISQAEAVSRNKDGLEVVEVAKKYGIQVFQPKKVIEIKDELNKLEARAGILVAFGQIIPQSVIDIFPNGIINIHPSLLPIYRGSSPIEEAILHEPKETGVSLMALTAEMDAGPIYAQARITPNYNHLSKADLASQLIKLGVDLLIKNLDSILSGTLEPATQSGDEEPEDESKMILSYTGRINKEDGKVDFDNMLASYIERAIRAYTGWPKSRAKVLGQDIIITKARVAKDSNDGDLIIKCRLGWLEIQELTAPSGRTITGAEFLRGYGSKTSSSA